MRRHVNESITRWPRIAALWALACWAAAPAAGAQTLLTAWPSGGSYAPAERGWYPGAVDGGLGPETLAAERVEPGARADDATDAGAVATAELLIPTAEGVLGTRYRWGGQSPVTGFDCSGFVGYVFAAHGIGLPRTARAMAAAGTALPASWNLLRPGDLVMFAGRGSRISHVAIYAGSGRIIHATSSGGRVRYDDLDTPRGGWYKRRMVAARRVIGDESASGELDLLDPRAPSAVRVTEVRP